MIEKHINLENNLGKANKLLEEYFCKLNNFHSSGKDKGILLRLKVCVFNQ